MSQKPATIKEIAQQLNVSVSTVSRALHDHPSIGLRTKMQVKKLAEELNYEPNQAAISFKQGKTHTLGVILPSLYEDFFVTAISTIEEIAMANGYTVFIGQLNDDVEREKHIADTMRRHRVDGIIVSLAKSTKNYDHFEQLSKFKIPVVFFDRIPGGEQFNTVSCNLSKSSEELVDWLVKQGRKRIAFIKGPDAILHSNQRLEGYLAGLQNHKIKINNVLMVSTDLTSEKTKEAIQKLLALKNPPDAIISFNDYVALDAIKFAREEGVKINKDIFFVSYANLPITSYMQNPPVASVEQFPTLQAEKAVELLLGQINQDAEERKPQRIVLESRVVVNS
ncbi:MAG: LacI family DNA-binding transcriptional regulator [Chitinophagaceae bacterium]